MLSFAKMQQRFSKSSECFLIVLMFEVLQPLKLIRATKVAETADKNIYNPAPCTEFILTSHCAQSSYMWPLFTWHHQTIRVKKLCFLLVYIHAVLYDLGGVYLLYMLNFKVSCVYCC